MPCVNCFRWVPWRWVHVVFYYPDGNFQNEPVREIWCPSCFYAKVILDELAEEIHTYSQIEWVAEQLQYIADYLTASRHRWLEAGEERHRQGYRDPRRPWVGERP